MNRLVSKAQSVTIQFDDGFEISLVLDSIKGIPHPHEQEFVVLEVPVFTSTSTGSMMVTPRQMDSFMRSSLLREAHKWLTQKQ